jgi:hypothetical protein
MKLLDSWLGLSFTLSFLIWQSAAATVPPRGTHERVSRRTAHEVSKSERKLGVAIRSKDVVSLERLLADYFAASYEGSEKATGKVAVVELCRAGMLPYYQILAEPKLEARAELVEVAGLARSSLRAGTDREDKRVFRVKRLWTKQDGRWLLVSQTLTPVDADADR